MNALYYLYNRSGRFFRKFWKMGRASLEVIPFQVYIDSAADVAAKRNFKVK